MSAEDKARANRFVDEFFNKKNVGIMDELFTVDYVEYDANFPQGLRGRAAVKEYYTSFITAFPDMQMTVEHVISEGDKVVQQLTWTGTHNGPLVGPGGAIPPTGKRITTTGMHVARIADGKAVEGWGYGDDLGLMQQLGIIPTMGG